MKPERFEQVKRLYQGALERQPADRTTYLGQACGDDEDLRSVVESLLSAREPSSLLEGLTEEEAARLLDSSAATPGSDDIVRLLGRRGGLPSPPPHGPGRETLPDAGDVIGDYEILEKIGGNMGFVFKARHRLLDKVVALKLLPAGWTADPARLARFQRELRVMGHLEHPNLVTASDARVEGRWHLVAMELIDGCDLERLVEAGGPLPVAEACEAVRQAALGLEQAHRRGLIHRDIKPSNLMLTRSGTIKVIDMGLALARGERGTRLTETGLMMGTVSYCAPEQFRNASRVDLRADVYSLGCTLFQLLAGKPPYWKKSTVEVIQAHLNEPFPTLDEERLDAPPGLEKVLARMTAKSPDGRFESAGAVAGALSLFTEGADLASLFSDRKKPAASPGKSGNRSKAASRKRDAESGKAGATRVLPAAAPLAVPASRRLSPAVQARRLGRLRGARDGAGDRPRRSPGRSLGTALAMLLVVAASVYIGTLIRPGFPAENGPPVRSGLPVAVLMDTSAAGGVYDKENITAGRTNADELSKVLGNLVSSHKENLSATWEREPNVLELHPEIVLIHRSSFFHSLNEQIGLGLPPFEDEADMKRWEALYDAADEKLIALIGHIGSSLPYTKFLVYSRGTDKRWLERTWRDDWVSRMVRRFPKLDRRRIKHMVIAGGKAGTFRNPEVAGEITDLVKSMLGLPEDAR